MADESSSNLSSSTDDGEIAGHGGVKQPGGSGFTSDDEGWGPRRSVAASLRDFAESMMRREVAELEMMKAREAARIAAENRRLETENELTEMMMKTQLQVASFLCSRIGDRKRKRSEEDDGESPVAVQR